MKSLLWVIWESFILYIAVRVSSGAPVFQDEGQSLQSSEFSSGGPESLPGGISSRYQGASSQPSTQEDLSSSWDSAASQSQQERSESGGSRGVLNHLVTGFSHGSSKNLPISTQDSKVLVETRLHHLARADQATATSESSDGMKPLSAVVENQEPDHRTLNVTTSSVAQIDRVRHAREAHMTTTAALVDLPGASSPGVASSLENLLPYEFFVRLEYLRQEVYELAEKIEKLKTSSGELSPLHEQHPESHSFIPLYNLSKGSSHPNISYLKNYSKNLGSQFISWNLATPEPSLLSNEAAINPSVGTDDHDSFVNMVNYLRNKQTKGTRVRQVISEVLTTTSPVDDKEHSTNGPDKGSGVTYKDLKVMDPNLRPIDKLKDFLDKVASKEENYVDMPVKYYDDKDITQDPDRYLKLPEELTKQQKDMTGNEARKGEVPDHGGETISPNVVLNSTKPTFSVPVDVKPVSVDPILVPTVTGLVHIPSTSTELVDGNATERDVDDQSDNLIEKHDETDQHPVHSTLLEPPSGKPTTALPVVDPDTVASDTVEPTDAGPFHTEDNNNEPEDMKHPVVETVNVESTTSDVRTLKSVITEHVVEPSSIESNNMKPVTDSVVKPTSAEPVSMMPITELVLEPTTLKPMNMKPVITDAVEPTTTEPTSIKLIISELVLKSTTQEPISMKPGDRVPVDTETITTNPVSANFASPDSTITVHVPAEPPITHDSSPDVTPTVVIATPVTDTSSKPGTTVQETTVAITDDEQIASKIAREEVEKTPLQYHDHTVLLIGLLVAGLACVMVFVGASILCRVHHRKKNFKKQVDAGYLKPRYTRHNPLAR